MLNTHTVPNSFSDVDECINNPCQNTGNCTNKPGSYECYCIDGFEGKNCEKGKKISCPLVYVRSCFLSFINAFVIILLLI